MRATTITIKIIAVQKPALKIPPITSQELSVKTKAIADSHKDEYFFMITFFSSIAKALPDEQLTLKPLFLPFAFYNESSLVVWNDKL